MVQTGSSNGVAERPPADGVPVASGGDGVPNPFPAGTLEADTFRYVWAQLGYDAARPSPFRQAYHRAVGSADYELAGEREDVVIFSRSMRQLSSTYKAFTRKIAVRTVGSEGLWPEPAANNDSCARACALFRAWGLDLRSDARRRRSLPSQLRQIVEETVIGGDVLVNRIRPDGRPCVQLIESERIATPESRSVVTENMRNGVEVDSLGGAVAYHVTPYTSTGSSLAYGEHVKVDARHAVLFTIDEERVGQTRGMPLLTQGLTRIADKDEVHEAITVAMKITAVFVLLLKTGAPKQADKFLSDSINRSAGSGGEAGANVRNVVGMKPGQILSAGPNDDVKPIKGENPPAGFDVWNRVIDSVIASCAGIPVEVATGDFRGMNFSQSRMSNMFAEETVAVFREELVTRVLRPMFRWLATRWVIDGVIPPDPSQPDGIPVPASWTRPPEVEYDRLTAIKASKEAVDNNLSTRTRETRRMGLDYDEIIAERGREASEEKARGIVPPSTPGAKVPGADAQAGGEGETPPG